MTLLAAPIATGSPATVHPNGPTLPWHDLAVVAAIGCWGTYLTWGAGGHEPHRLSVSVAVLAAALLVVRPWAVLPLRLYALLTSIGVAAFGVALTAPTGWAGANDAAAYAYTAQLAALVLAWASTRTKKVTLLAVVLFVCGLEFAKGWLGWWGGQDLARPYVGTFFWHNQAGIFLAAGALLAATAVLSGERALAALGWVLGPMCAAGVVLSTSRGSQLGLVLGFLTLLVAVAVMPGARWTRGLSLVLLGVLSSATTLLFTSRLLFPDATKTGLGAATAATVARSSRESLSGNEAYRLEFWRRSLAVFAHWPWSGAGFHSFAGASKIATNLRGGASTALVHNGFLQILSDGGLLLGIPVLTALAVAGWWLLRSLRDAWRVGDLLSLGAGTVVLVLALHSAIDFDWSYVSLMAMLAVVLPLCGNAPRVAVRRRWLEVGLASTAVALLAVAAVASWHGGLVFNLPMGAAA